MAHNPEWHAEYARLERAELRARIAYRDAEKAINRKRSAAGIAEAEANRAVALAALRAASTARFEYEMAATKIVNIAELSPADFARALWPNR